MDRGFVVGAIMYFLIGIGFVSLFRENGVDIMLATLASVPQMAVSTVRASGLLIVALAIPLAIVPRGIRARTMAAAAVTAGATMIFFLTFTVVKTTLPEAVPFFADPALARFDTWLHGGIDPWVLTHRWVPNLPPAVIEFVYIDLWLLPAIYLPCLLVLADRDSSRRKRFFILYFLAWVGLGNVLALAGMSGGPIYHDRLTGLASFAGLHEALATSGIVESRIGFIQDKLWEFYATGRQLAGSGISAFPSVHVAMATVVALYIYERCPQAAPIAGLIVLAYLFLSVHLAWHYAIDGYASILVIAGIWRFLRARSHPGGTPETRISQQEP